MLSGKKTVKVLIEIPKEMLELAKDPTIKNRPYDLCGICPFSGEGGTCDGPNCLAMESDRRVEWWGLLADINRLTRQHIADSANLPLSTVNGAMTGRSKDLRISTIASITRAIMGGSWGQYPCHLAALLMHHTDSNDGEIIEVESVQKQIADLKHELRSKERELELKTQELEGLRGTLTEIHTSYLKEMDAIREDAQKKIDHLKKESDEKSVMIMKLLER